MRMDRATIYAVLALVLTVAASLADWFGPEGLETDFLHILPVLLCIRVRWRWLPFLVAALDAALIGGRDIVLGIRSGPGGYDVVNDAFDVVTVLLVAVFVAGRIRMENALNGMIAFIDGRMEAADNRRLREMLAK